MANRKRTTRPTEETKSVLVIDAETGTVAPTPSEIPLSSAVDVRREQAKVYREARGGLIDKGEATKLIYILDAIRKSIELEEVERRLTELEERTSGGRALPAPAAQPH